MLPSTQTPGIPCDGRGLGLLVTKVQIKYPVLPSSQKWEIYWCSAVYSSLEAEIISPLGIFALEAFSRIFHFYPSSSHFRSSFFFAAYMDSLLLFPFQRVSLGAKHCGVHRIRGRIAQSTSFTLSVGRDVGGCLAAHAVARCVRHL